jgi:succinyl-diaminopimelate desuccinylase
MRSRSTTVSDLRERVLREVDDAAEEVVELAAELVRIPTVNPPGKHYRECAELIGRRLEGYGFEVDYPRPPEQPASSELERVNVVGLRRGDSARPLVHLNGHIDVVPVGEGWSVDPFAGEVRDGRLYGRGAADMKAGLAAALVAADSLRRAGVPLRGSIEVSGTVDEESGGFAGVAHLAESGRIARARTDHVIIPEPFEKDRICLGHRGVYWCRVVAHGRIAHGSMPFLGKSAVDPMSRFLELVRTELRPRLASRTTAMPVTPEEARCGTINVNALAGGQAGEMPQTPCVADRCEAILDRRFLLEEGLDAARSEIGALVEGVAAQFPGWRLEVEDLLAVHPTLTPRDDRLVTTLEAAITEILGRRPDLVASPGTYDHKHVTGSGGVVSCVAYGPGVLEQAHQPDEWCAVEDLVEATKVLTLSLVELVGGR